MDIDEIAARLEIQQVILRYCRGTDRCDTEMMASVYHSDAMDHHGPYDMLGREFAEHICTMMRDRPGGNSQHHITNVLIEVEGDQARAESYFLGVLPKADDAGEYRLASAGGRYLDRFERRDGSWLIAERWVVYDWSRDLLAGKEWTVGAQFPRGSRDASDPSFAMFPLVAADH